MVRYPSRVVGSALVLGFVAGCGDDGRVFDEPSQPGRADADVVDGGGELPTVDGGEAGVDASESAPPVASSGQATEVVTVAVTDGGSSAPAPASSDAGVATTGSEAGSSASNDAAPPPVVVTVEAEGTGDLIGYPATLSAVGTATDGAAVAYAWAFASKPNGSELEDGDIDVLDDSATFYPDVAGEYLLEVTASTAAGESAAVQVTVRAHAYDVGYLNVAGDQDSWTYAGFMVGSDGSNPRQVGCYFQNTATSESEWLTTFQQQGKICLMPYFPKDVDTPARIAYSQPSSDSSYQMFIAGPDNDCGGNAPPQVVGGTFPTFSPNGERVAVMTQEVVPDPLNEGSTRSISNVVTYKVDGTDARVLRAEYTGSDSGVSWVDDETLTWVEDGENGSIVYRVKDVAGAFGNDLLSEVIMDCSLATTPVPAGINHAVERGGVLFVASSYTAILSPGSSTYAIWQLERTAGGGYDCDQAAPTTRKVAGDNAHDYDVSPDGTKLLYFSTVDATETETSASQLFLLDLASSAEPLALSAEPSTIASGAHFAANGRQLVWTETRQVSTTVGETTYERPEQSRVVVANADGSRKRTVVVVSSSPNQARMFHTGGNSYCSLSAVGTAGTVGIGGMGSLLAMASLLARRRRRS